MYDNLISCVRTANNEYTEFFSCPTGVRQGCVLSPTLFSLFINQLANDLDIHGIHGVNILPNVIELFILLFADDVALLSSTPRGLQAQLNILKECCDRLKMTVNKDKTKIMVFRKGGFLARNERWFYDGEPVDVVNTYTYLGFTFTTKLSCKIGTTGLVSKAKKALHLLNVAYVKCNEMTQKTFFKIFDAKVQSILLYSAEVWGAHRLDSIEKVHLLACKRYLGTPLKTPNKLVYGELGRYPLFVNSTLRTIRYWLRLLEMDANRLPKQCYQMLHNLAENNKKCWATDIRDILCTTGFQFAWTNQGVGNKRTFLSAFKQRLIDIFIQEWSSTIQERDRYSFYKTFKDNFGQEKYLLNIDVVCFRIAFSQTRLGVLPINNNMQRFNHNAQERLCPCCGRSVEDEYHLLFICPLYNDLRWKLLNNFSGLPLSRLLEAKNNNISRQVGKFMCYAIARRQRFLA